VTFYASNREVRPAGAEVEEFVTEPEPVPPEPPDPQGDGTPDEAETAADGRTG
jgi:hypothetical protein